MEKLNKYFLFEIRERSADHYNLTKLNSFASKFEISSTLTGSDYESVDTFSYNQPKVEYSFVADRLQVGITAPLV